MQEMSNEAASLERISRAVERDKARIIYLDKEIHDTELALKYLRDEDVTIVLKVQKPTDKEEGTHTNNGGDIKPQDAEFGILETLLTRRLMALKAEKEEIYAKYDTND